MLHTRIEEKRTFSINKCILRYINNKYSKQNIILGGDFNVNTNQINTIKTADFVNLFLEHNFTQHIKQPTHITETCLDVIFTNFKHNSLYISVEDLGFSDHLATILFLFIFYDYL